MGKQLVAKEYIFLIETTTSEKNTKFISIFADSTWRDWQICYYNTYLIKKKIGNTERYRYISFYYISTSSPSWKKKTTH